MSEQAEWEDEARRQLGALETALAGHEEPAVMTLHAFVRERDVGDCLGWPDVGLTPTEWRTVLEVVGDEMFVRTSEDLSLNHTRSRVLWYVRYDGTEWVYGTESYGEMYRGDESSNAFRQVNAVLESENKLVPQPMSAYPIDVDHNTIDWAESL